MKPSIRVAFRVDASAQIGTGHLMRCLTLANALRERGASTRFVCQHLPYALQRLVEQQEHELIHLYPPGGDNPEKDVNHPPLLGVGQDRDAHETLRALADRTWDWMVVDHYDLGAHWEAGLRRSAANIMAIDDLADRPHDCDVLLDQNYYKGMELRYDKLVSKACVRLIGPRYALLRSEFLEVRKQLPARCGRVNHIHICFGGADPERQTLLALEAVRRFHRHSLQTDVVVGPANPDCEYIQSLAAQIEGIKCHIAPRNMARLMAKADLALGSGGVSTNERLRLGLPAIVSATSLHQVTSARDIDEAGGHRYLGLAMKLSAEAYASAMDDILNFPEVLMEISEIGVGLVDGRGVERVVATMFDASC